MLSAMILNKSKATPLRFLHNYKSGLIIIFVFYSFISVANSEEQTDLKTSENRLKPIKVDVTTHLGDKQTFLKGDSISFLLSLDADAYLLAIYEDASGSLTQIIPNKQFSKTFYKAGLFITLPDENAAFNFKVQAPFGKETLWVYASDVPLPEIEGRHLENGLKQLEQDIISIKRLILNHKQTAFGETSLEIHTKDNN